jgi:hypothetical protein
LASLWSLVWGFFNILSLIGVRRLARDIVFNIFLNSLLDGVFDIVFVIFFVRVSPSVYTTHTPPEEWERKCWDVIGYGFFGNFFDLNNNIIFFFLPISPDSF